MKQLYLRSLAQCFRLPVVLSVSISRLGERLWRGGRGYRVYQRRIS